MKREIWKGSEAIAEAAIRAGCRGFFGYPITPQNEIPEYMSLRMPQVGGVFVQAESEVAAINMVYGAAGSGVRAMTSSSSPGVSLKQEGISYAAGAQLPAVIVNVMRGGPGLGSIQPSQADYFQATRGGGNGDYRTPVLAPANLQEAVDLVQEAFDIADQYRTPVVVLADGLIGQMMEPIVWKEHKQRPLPPKDWASSGRGDRDHNNFINSLLIDAPSCEKHNEELLKIYAEIEKNEVRWEEIMLEDAELVFTAYGTPARIAITVAENLRKKGIKAGVFRPITLWPFPYARLREIAEQASVKVFLDVEMSAGQMVEDVKLAVGDRKPIDFYGRLGGMIPTVSEIEAKAEAVMGEVK
ncbi:3-methyl-2-oxobutanoate dehydrogenase subunit VorB [Megasphaera sp. ASD88]|jgi:2-oxoglutarate ferredoxin oxidoreductase subunit alpha|uniref:3-methyl-2-oxobutanoate dehydrogenase subunit VorB n=1 Tax=Megasphaera stantonii TaxID=2144175 RepID=A0A346B056_9FIRM|nr:MULTISPECIES: 3-methyl-2-oxobutanoate dehydrogenase subunit VorB [Megasphaera]MDN0045479.1 3-methyl-2-oxobutanoate dehydrogenase subunit VorB [Megasphaera hexanoica]SCI15506.1 Pyruvate synthase subunit porA [uncultured Ruminococcus sp.]AXL21499.1 3-methyl-2-oxobutanoate dehydrogenase subunit VorB [Megasphaera stantonii]MBM6732793.1 3-methyl-2-oxobutanoate dehydrogenase subunit VorB [Megasphaera stantonii]MCU6713585.1 3-methyl-2-oxobutanoate dehydrogenase subunit VorB [Megasphaera butyrica]